MRVRLLGSAVILLASASLIACSPEGGSDDPDSVSPSPSVGVSTPAAAAPTAGSPAADLRAEREAAYDADVNDWPKSLPAGYTWPAFSDLPRDVGPQLSEGQNAGGVYRCILLDAAWNAYNDDDAALAMAYAVEADQYAVAGNPSLYPVTRHKDTVFGEIDIAHQICRGVVGDLTR